MRKQVEESVATGVAAGRGRGGRFSAGRKREVVMRLLRGEDLESVSRAVGDHGGAGGALAGSVSGCGAGGPQEPRTGCSGRRPSSAAGQDRRAADGDRVTVREGGPAGGRRPVGPAEVDAMSGAQSISTRRASGVQRVCRVWHRARSSVYARRQATRSPALCRRRGPIGAAPDDVLVAHIRRVLEASPFHGEGYRKAWAKLRVAGMRTSKERVRRLMREHDLQAPPRAGHAHGPKAHDGTITTEAPDVMWGTDMTATVTVAEGAAFVFVAVDHCATACIGLHAAKRGTRFEALEPIRQGIRERFGGIGEGVARGLRLRHDHGSNYLADDFQQEVAFLRHRKFPELRAGARRQRRRGALHPHAEGESVVGAELRDDRGAPPGFARVQADVQRAVDAGEVRLPKPGPGATRPPRAGRGGVEANTVKPLSKNPGAVHLGLPHDHAVGTPRGIGWESDSDGRGSR